MKLGKLPCFILILFFVKAIDEVTLFGCQQWFLMFGEIVKVGPVNVHCRVVSKSCILFTNNVWVVD